MASYFTGQLSWVLTGSFAFATQLLMMLYILFYFIRDHREGIGLLRSLVPLSNPETDEVFARVEDTINATIYGTVIVGLVQGLVAWILYLVLGLPAPLLWGALTAVLAIVPVLGPSIVWIPAALILALQGAYVKAGLITVGGIVIGLIGHFLYPILVGHKLRLHPVLVFFAFIGGLAVFGIAGLIIGPAVLALTEALVNVWQRRTADGHPPNSASKPRPGRPILCPRRRRGPGYGLVSSGMGSTGGIAAAAFLAAAALAGPGASQLPPFSVPRGAGHT